jgi:hypothetical protein
MIGTLSFVRIEQSDFGSLAFLGDPQLSLRCVGVVLVNPGCVYRTLMDAQE